MGFCRGCGASWPLELPAPNEKIEGETFPQQARVACSQKTGWRGRLAPSICLTCGQRTLGCVLGLLGGPLGLLYCTMTGTLVMLFVSMVLWIKFGDVSFLIVQPVCAIWAWRAARGSYRRLCCEYRAEPPVCALMQKRLLKDCLSGQDK